MIREGALCLLIKNRFITPVRCKGERFISARHGGYGVGTQSARTVVQNYGGDCVFEYKDGVFSVSALFFI